MVNNHSYKIDGAELYCKAQIYNNLSHNCHMVCIRLPQDYMTMDDIEKYAKKQVENKYISVIKIIGVGASVLGYRDSNA